MACRVRAEPSARREIDWGAPVDSFSINANRVSAPNAAKTADRTLSATRCRAPRLVVGTVLGPLFEVVLDIGHLLGPTIFIHSECFEPAILRQCIKS